MQANSYKRIVVKVGTSAITRADGTLDVALMRRLMAQLASIRGSGWQTVLVSSGAIQAGRSALGRGLQAGEPSTPVQTLPQKQALAAVGQPLLMAAYSRALALHKLHAAQVLLTREDLANRHRFTNAANTLHALLAMGAVPIVNENDTVAVDEIRFGDNDTLAARVAVLANAQLLLILSDVAGLLPLPPGSRTNQAPIPVVEEINSAVEALATGSASGLGTGGMRTKLDAAKIAARAGVPTIVAYGRKPHVICLATENANCGTLFAVHRRALHGRKRWIAAAARSQGTITVNSGAATAIGAHNGSLLAVGITTVQGEFSAGDIVEIVDANGARIGRGITRFAAVDLALLAGLRSDEIRARLGADCPDEVVHRDDMALGA